MHLISKVLFRHFDACILEPSGVCHLHSLGAWGGALILCVFLNVEEPSQPAGRENAVHCLSASDPSEAASRHTTSSSLDQTHHIKQAGEAPSEPERAAHEAEIWPKGQAEPRITLLGRDHVSSQEGEGFALWFGEPRCSAPKACPLSCLPANAEPHRDTQPHPRPQKEIN